MQKSAPLNNMRQNCHQTEYPPFISTGSSGSDLVTDRSANKLSERIIQFILTGIIVEPHIYFNINPRLSGVVR